MSVSVPVCLSVGLSDCLSDCMSVCLSDSMYACLSACPSVCPSVCPYVCLSVCLCVCLFVCLSDCLTVSSSDCPSVYRSMRYFRDYSWYLGENQKCKIRCLQTFIIRHRTAPLRKLYSETLTYFFKIKHLKCYHIVNGLS